MFEDIKFGKYTIYSDYLNEDDVIKINNWYNSFSQNGLIDFNDIINLMYELYLYVDIDLKPYEDYQKIRSYFAEKYTFENDKFLDLYCEYRKLVFGVR